MIVVADATPVHVLVQLGHQGVLPKLFQEVVVPMQVVTELTRAKTPVEVRDFINSPPAWLLQREPLSVEPIAGIHFGEQAAISLAQELSADLLLIDDKDGRRAAIARHLSVTGTIGVLERAADAGLLDLQETFGRLPALRFRATKSFLEARLNAHLLRRSRAGRQPPPATKDEG